MSLDLVPLTRAAWPRARDVAADAGLAAEFEPVRDAAGMAAVLDDPFACEALGWLALDAGRPVAFSYGFLLPAVGGGHWSMTRIGVIEAARRRGIGTALLDRSTRAIRPVAGRTLVEQMVSAWVPNPAAEAFAARHGFTPQRWFWQMGRAPTAVPEPVLPDGCEVRTFDGSARMLEDWNDIHLRSFARNYHFVATTVEEARRLAALPSFRADGLALAYRDGRCVGFCRNTLGEPGGEVDMLGVAPEARGTGLGRALLRWGARWIVAAGGRTVRLSVDGANDTALALYRSEGFETVRTRALLGRPLPVD